MLADAPHDRVVKAAPRPLLPVQAQLCAHELVDPTARQYSIGFLVTFDEREHRLDVPRFCAAFRRVVDACDALRMEVVTTSDGIGQVVVPSGSGPPAIDPSETVDLEARVREVGERRALREFVAAVHPPRADEPRRAHARLIVLGEHSHAVLFEAHHAFFDDGSYRAMLARLEREYVSVSSGSTGAAPSFLAHLEAAPRCDAVAAPIEPRRLSPYGHETERGTSRSRLFERRLGDARRAAVARVARTILGSDGIVECGNIVFAAFAAWLARIDAAPLPRTLEIGMPTHRRSDPELREMIGMLQRPVLVAFDVGPDDDLASLARRIHDSARSAIRAAKDIADPLDLRAVDAFFNNMPVRAKRFAGIPIRNRYLPRGSEPSFVHGRLLGIDDEKAALGLELRVDVIGEALAARALPQLFRILDAWLSAPDRRLATLDLESAAEMSRRRAVESGPAVDRSRFHGVDLASRILAHGLRADAASRIALRDDALALDYATLATRVGATAKSLTNAGAKARCVIAIESPRSIDAAVFALAALHCGAAVSFVDPQLPAARRAEILDFLRPTLVLGAEGTMGAGKGNDARILPFDDAAFVVHTSGSTGKPRAVVLSHRALLVRHEAFARVIPFESSDVGPWKTPLAFVDSIAEWIDPLLAGIEVAIVDDATVKDARAFLAALERVGATRLTAVPSLLNSMLAVRGGAIERICAEPRRPFLPRLRSIVASGEELSPELAARLRSALPAVRILDVYGSSETTADATFHELRPSDLAADRIPIGRPIDGTVVAIVDSSGAPVPLHAIGEIAVAGECLALGELDSALSRRFLPLPAFPGALRAFRTGDRGRFTFEGLLEYHGRVDRRLKIRGAAVEPGAVEIALRSHPGVAEAAVVGARDGEATSLHLRAFVVTRGEPAPTPAALREHLARELTATSIPREFCFVQRLPRLPSGKVDLIALTSSRFERAAIPARDLGPRATVPPNESIQVERAILDAVRERLRDPSIDADSDFFASGGDSLLAIDVALAIEKRTGLVVPIGALATFPTARTLAAHLLDATLAPTRDSSGMRGEDPTPICIPLSRGNTGTPLFLVPPAGYDVGALIPLARRLSVPLIGLQPRGITERDESEPTIEAMAARYVAAIRTLAPHGPYRIGGRCFGGIVAFEIVRQLEASGARVDAFVLIDVLRPPGLARIASDRIPDAEIEAASNSERSRLRLARKQLEARQRYDGSPIRTPAVYFSGGANPIFDSARGAWSALLRGGIEIVEVPGGHRNLMTEPRVRLLADGIERALGRRDRSSLAQIPDHGVE